MSDSFSPLAGFCGAARLFPLPNMVFFPQVMQPLHIFESRYRQMTAEALAGDRLLALVLPRPGWETDYGGCPAIHSVATLGQIVADQQLEDGRFNILLKGLSRVQIVQEMPQSKLYRKAKVELLAEVPIGSAKGDRRWRKRIAEKMPFWFVNQAEVQAQFQKLLKSDLPLGPLSDILSFALPLAVEIKQTLLEELEVAQRLNKLLTFLEGQGPAAATQERRFPPEFSEN